MPPEASDRRYRALLEKSYDGVVVFDGAASIKYVSPAFERLLGYGATEMLGRSAFALLHPEEETYIRQRLASIVDKTGGGQGMTLRCRHRSGSWRWLEGIATNLLTDPAVGGIVVNFRDVTERKAAEDRLLYQLQLNETITRYAPQGLLMTDGTGRLTYMNPAAEALVGWKASELLGQNLFTTLCRDQPDAHRAVLESREVLQRSGVVWERRDGKRIEVFVTCAPILHDGKVAGLVMVAHDETERKAAERALADSQARLLRSEATLRQLAESIPNMVWATDADGVPEFCNERFVQYFGLTCQDLRRDQTSLPIHPADRERAYNAWALARTLGREYAEELRLRRVDGKYRWHLCRALPVRDEQGRIVRWCGTDTDIDAQRRGSEELEHAKRDAETATENKSGFLALMSHEMRTPLGAILGYADLLQEGKLSPRDRTRFLATLKRNGELLARLINDILDLAKVEAGHLDVERLPVSVRALVGDVVTLLEKQAADKGVRLRVDWDGEVPDSVETDPTRFRQILLNIVGNAVKFTADGEVVLTVRGIRQSHRRPGEALIAVLVKDSGPGIAPADQAKLFEPFVQAERSTSRRYGGTGLGLSLSRRLAQLLGGDVTLVESQPGQGSTFLVTVSAKLLEPGAATAAAQAPGEAGHPLDGVHVLVVDDSEDNRTLLQKILADAGARVSLARQGGEGVERAVAADGPSVDVVLMDLHMPDVDGFEATAQLRRRGFRRPIIALTAYAMNGEREKSLESGCDDHLTQPIDRSLLLERVADLAHELR